MPYAISAKRINANFKLNQLTMRYLFPILLLLFTACKNEPESTEIAAKEVTEDVHTYANIKDVRTEHLDLDLDVNFENNTIYGTATHHLSKHSCDKFIVDIKGLEIVKVTLDGKNETDFRIGKMDELLGQALEISIKESTKTVSIQYETTAESSALDWLPPALTSSKKHPFLYTQGQAILTRTAIVQIGVF